MYTKFYVAEHSNRIECGRMAAQHQVQYLPVTSLRNQEGIPNIIRNIYCKKTFH